MDGSTSPTGLDVPMRPDHAPSLKGDVRLGGSSGYRLLGKVFAVGCMRGLAECVETMGYQTAHLLDRPSHGPEI